jgi:hypothetical protein
MDETQNINLFFTLEVSKILKDNLYSLDVNVHVLKILWSFIFEI